ncbi:MAG: ATPase [Betaproteobacteria bacterium]|nr:MAG: ATPase [Betaproteobacteria bacterium]TMH07390.1 MAG: ATPase [Betaproteobacteria bacterium]
MTAQSNLIVKGLLLGGAFGFPLIASAAIISGTDTGFEVLETVSVAASPKESYARLVNIAAWWNKAHTFSGDSANLTLDARPGGCFCERLKDGGGVQHLTVTYVAPNQALRFSGALGPLQSLGVAGSMTIALTGTAGGGTDIALRYRVGGYATDGIKKWAGPVDEVLGEQIARLKRLIDSGSAESSSPSQK